MSHKLTSTVRKVDRILKSGLFTGNFNIFARAQPQSVEARRFVSQSSVYLSRKPKGFIGLKENSKGVTNGEKGAPKENIDPKANNGSTPPLPKSEPKDSKSPQSPVKSSAGGEAGRPDKVKANAQQGLSTKDVLMLQMMELPETINVLNLKEHNKGATNVDKKEAADQNTGMKDNNGSSTPPPSSAPKQDSSDGSWFDDFF